MTTAIERAIEEAVEGGYELPIIHSKNDIYMSALFWQSLGKARGWSKFACSDCYQRDGFTFDSCPKCIGERVRVEMETWKVEWHRFIDHLAEGKSAESFFASL